MQTHPLSIPQISTNRPAPLLPGYYSLQALSHDDAQPSVTQYHRTPEPALRWMKAMAKKNHYDAFLLSSTDTRWDVYNRHGKAIGTHTSIIPPEGVMPEILTPVQVDYDAYVASAQEIIGDDAICITWAEHHAYASSVGHSNMVVVARQMIMDASDKDLEHIYLVDSIASGCRVQGWFMDSSKVSSQFMDQYLDRYKWLIYGCPLEYEHHISILAYRMATLRPLQVIAILLAVGQRENLGENNEQVALRIMQAPPEKLIKFTSLMFDVLEEGMFFDIESAQGFEKIEKDAILEEAETIAGMYRDMFVM